MRTDHFLMTRESDEIQSTLMANKDNINNKEAIIMVKRNNTELMEVTIWLVDKIKDKDMRIMEKEDINNLVVLDNAQLRHPWFLRRCKEAINPMDNLFRLKWDMERRLRPWDNLALPTRLPTLVSSKPWVNSVLNSVN